MPNIFRARRRCAGRLRVLGLLLIAAIGGLRVAAAQTPSPVQEWQYPGGIVLTKLFEPKTPEWRVVVGTAVVAMPLYAGSRPYQITGGPVIDLRYGDLAFASVGEGAGVNVLRGDNYRAGFALGYDLGRHVSAYPSHLSGLGDISPAPVMKLFVSYAISKAYPVVLRADVRQFVGGADGVVGDLGIFMPLPGSSDRFILLAGPSITLADGLYMRREFGVSVLQAQSSGYHAFNARGGENETGLGVNATWLITDHWLANMDTAVTHLLGSARESPITQSATQGVVSVSGAYRW